ncbi:histidine kinase-like ATPase [Thelonectria olida]|uniref:Histidine kinase-like ATPase n=1 Tax=Thelonectria olida TaxID=1576542 RepID=A0A9P8WG90_9HYPO|nr:histidine kinase-like ATPase [Thelonectria olida]
MAVAPLPSSTTRLLGSSVVITDPISLVKELIDNSVDASATSIEVLVSPNTVDKIQVRDNGYGVSFEDFDFLGRRAHTSKLRNFEELEARGGETLGFRGDALASANSLATVKITTKTAQDPIATLIWLKPGNGGVEKEQPVSAPIGTMVQVLKLFENLPVRKQNAMKESRKSLSGIKRLLETYALAMPRLKLSFKVIGEPNQTWSYSPSSRATPREAVAQVFGNAVITQCVEKAVSLTSGSTEKPQRPAWGTLTAILPRQGCQLASIKGRGSFISVGSRPILSTRGTGKRLATIFKESLTGSLGQTQRTRSVTSPFMRLNITCNPRSYDASISPLKDEVIFKDEQAILDCFRDLCDCVYKSEGSDSDKDGRSYPSSSTAGNTNTIQLLTMRQLEKPASDPEHGSSPQAILNSANEFHDLGEEVVVDDLDLLEAMDKAEHDKQLGPSESSFEATHRVGARARQELTHTQVNAEKPDETGSSTTLAMMRTVINVNLARRESNTSDEGFTTGLILGQSVDKGPFVSIFSDKMTNQ